MTELLDTVMDQLATAHGHRALSRQMEFLRLSREIVDGKKPPAIDRVEVVLHEAGKTPDDLRTAVENYRKRKTWGAQIKTAEELESERQRHADKVNAAAEELEAAKQKYDKTVIPLLDRIATIDSAQVTAGQAADNLSRTCVNPEIDEKLRLNSLRGQEICPRITWARKAISDRRQGEQWLKNADALQGTLKAYQAADERALGTRMIAEADEAEKIIGDLQKEFDAVRAEETEIRKLMLVP